MKACAKCGIEVSESDLYASGDGEICSSCNLDEEISSRQSALSPLTYIALAGGLVPFFLSYSSSSTTTLNGVTTTSFMDYIAIAGGPIAILAGLTGIVAGLKGSNKLTRVGVPLTAVLLGIYQLLRGFGLT